MPPLFLDLEEVLEVHHDQIERYGGREGIRDLSVLQSALGMAQAASSTEYYHTDLFEMAAAYLFHIVKNHPFIDGNKRTGITAALVFLEMNGVELRATNNALLGTVLAVAEGTLGKSGIAEFFRKHSSA